MASFQDSIMSVLSQNRLYVSSPASIELGSDLYATPQTAVIESARRHRYTGRVKVSSNSLSLQGVSTFSLDPGVIYNKLYVYGKINFPINAMGGNGWAYNLIKSLEFKCSGSSSIQNLKIDGESLLDMILVSTNDSEKRNQLLSLGGKHFYNEDGAATQDFFIPLYMLFTSADSGNVYPFDSSTIRSPISFSIEWNNLYKCVSGNVTPGSPSDTNNPVTLPTSFSELFLRAHNTIELEDQFVNKKMQMYPQLTYSIPCNYIQSYRTTVNFSSLSSEVQIPLSTFPTGALQCIIMSVKPKEWEGTSDTLTWINNTVSVPLEYVRVLYNGQTMFETNSALEHEGVGCLMDDGASNLYTVLNRSSIYNTEVPNYYTSYITIIPMVNEISQVLRGKYHENVQSYSSSTLQIFMQLSQQGLKTVIPGSESAPGYTELPTGNYDVVFTYVTAALLEVNRATMSLQLE